MAKTKIVLNHQTDLILNNAQIVQPTGILKSDLPGLVDDLGNLVSSVTSAESARISGDASLSNEISVERGRIDAILDGSDVDLDQFREVVDFVQSIDLENDNALLSAVTSINSDILSEETRATAAEELLRLDLTGEVSRATAAEGILTSDLSDEVSRATAAEGILTSDLSDEVSRATAAEGVLTTDLASEVSRATAAEATLQSNINIEKGRIDAILDGSTVDLDQFREVVDFIGSVDLANDESLLSAVTEINGKITDEETSRIAADVQLSEDLSTLQTYVNTTISDTISVLTDDILAETTRATEAEQILRDDLDAEIAARIAADVELDVRITDIISNTDLTAVDSFAEVVRDLTAEITRATDAESTLQDAIDAEVSRATAAESDLDATLRAIIVEEHAHHTAAEELLTTNLDAEVVRATAAEELLTTNLDDEVVRATAAEDSLETIIGLSDLGLNAASRWSEYNSYIDGTQIFSIQIYGWNEPLVYSTEDFNSEFGPSNLSNFQEFMSELDRRMTQDNGERARAAILDEEAARIAADATLQSNIDTEKARIDAILDGSTVDLDQFAEVVSFVQSIDLTNDDALLNAVIGIEDSISDEAAERQAADSAIEDSISSLESNINSELSTLSNSLNTEIEDRISAIESVEGSITELTETLDSAIITINDSIDEVIASVAEQHAHHTAAEETLQANINVEKARIDAILEGSDVDLDQFREVVAFVESIDLENDEALMNAIIGIEDSIAQETSDRESADLAIEDAISSLESTLSSNISTLTTSLDTEISDRISAIETIEDEIADLTESLDSSVLTINDTINGVVLDLEAEVTRATGAEGLLQSSINVEKARIDAILEGSDVDLDQFREVVAFVESIDLENDESLMNAVIGIENSITDESAARESADLAIEDSISSLESTLSSSISTLTTSLDTEISDRISSIEAIEDEIADLAESLDSSVLTINDTIDGIVSDLESEVTRATEAETTLQSNIDVEKGRIDAILLGSDVDLDQFSEIVSFVQSIDLTNDEALLNAVIGIENSITDEASARESADEAIEDSIASLESNLNSEISTLTSSLNTEIDNRISDIASVEESIADLSETVDTAIIEINDSIDAEVVRATAAEAALDAAKLNLAGGTMSGQLTMGGNMIGDASIIGALKLETDTLTALNSGLIVLENNLDANNITTIINLPAPTATGDAANKTYVDAGDATLQSAIDIEKGRIDAILDGSTVDLDQFAEVVSFVQSIDLTNDEALLTAVTSINTSINEEITAREDADADLQSQIDALSTSSNEALLAAIAEEHAHHTAAEEAISLDLSNEITRAELEEARLNSALNTEIARAYEAEQALDAAKLNLAGGTMSGDIDMAGNRINSADRVTSTFIETDYIGPKGLGTEINISGSLRMNDGVIIDLGAPTDGGDATNKTYVDAGDSALAADLADLQAYVDTTVDSAIATLTSDLAAETAARIADVDSEETRALAAEGVLQSNLNTEATERAAEDITLQGNIDTEAARAQAAETAIAADLATETATRIAEVAAEVARATAAENVLTTDLAAEITRATGAETTLQSNINTEKGRIDAILLASEADKDSFAEIVTLINSVDTTNDTAFASYVLSNDAALADEILARETADNNLSDDISSEEAARIYADNVLQTNITTEVSRATAAEDALSAALSAEESSRIAGDTSLQSSLNNEITDRIAAVQSVQSALDIESNRAIAAEGVLTTDLATEVARATAAEGVLTTNLATEVSRATAAEGVLTTNLATEVTRATAAEGVLTTNLAIEVSRATAAEGVLTTNLAGEVSRATAAETALATDFANIYSKKVTVAETSNGTLTTFTLNKPVRLGSEMIYVNGLLMEEGDDYTTIITSGKVSGVEFITAPLSNMKVRAYGVCGL